MLSGPRLVADPIAGDSLARVGVRTARCAAGVAGRHLPRRAVITKKRSRTSLLHWVRPSGRFGAGALTLVPPCALLRTQFPSTVPVHDRGFSGRITHAGSSNRQYTIHHSVGGCCAPTRMPESLGRSAKAESRTSLPVSIYEIDTFWQKRTTLGENYFYRKNRDFIFPYQKFQSLKFLVGRRERHWAIALCAFTLALVAGGFYPRFGEVLADEPGGPGLGVGQFGLLGDGSEALFHQ